MNSLSLRISNNGINCKKSESKVPLFFFSNLQDQKFRSEIKNIDDFINASNVSIQLEFIKSGANFLNEDQCNNIEASNFIKLLVVIFLDAPLKHPLKNACARILSSRSSDCAIIESTITNEILKRILSLKNCDDFNTLNSLCNAFNSCFENFPSGVQGMQNAASEVLMFFKSTLISYTEKMRNDCKMSPTEKMELYTFIHNTFRVMISILQKYEISSTVSLNEDLLKKISSLSTYLLNHNDVPMDTKGLCSMALLIILKLRFGPDAWIYLLQNVYKTDDISNHAVYTEIKQLNPETVKLYICSAIINIIEIDETATKCVGKTPALTFVCLKLVELSEQLSVDTTTILGVARTMLSISRLLYKVLDLNISIKTSASILNFVWSHLEYYVDSVRHLCTQILTNIVKLSVMFETKDNTLLSNEVFSSVITLPKDRHSKYKALATLGSEYGCIYLLNKIPNLVEELLSAINNVTVPANVSFAFETLMIEHSKEVSMDILFSTWIRPTLNAVITFKDEEDNVSSPTLTILEDILTKAVKLNSSIVPLMIPAILEQNTLNGDMMSDGQLKCILICLHVARKMGIFDTKKTTDQHIENSRWKNVIEYDLLQSAMTHRLSEIRIMAFSLIVDSHKTTESYLKTEFQLVLIFLKYNINVQSPAVRQKTLSLAKKMVKRWKDSFDVVLRNVESLQNKIIALLSGEKIVKIVLVKVTDAVYSAIATRNIYIKFIKDLWKFSIENIFPGANYSRRNMSLQILVWCQEMKSTNIKWEWKTDYLNSLVHCLEDSYECNKQLAVELLMHCPDLFSQKTSSELFEEALTAASSVKPTDCISSAYKFELLTNFNNCILPVLQNDVNLRDQVPFEPQYLIISILIKKLSEEMNVACKNILVAAAKGPLYGLLFCIRHLLTSVDFSVIASSNQWSVLLNQLINMSFEVNEIVAPIVNNSSPEGHLPMDFNAGPTLGKGSGVQLRDGQKVTAQMVLLCAWRSVKEVSLLLGDISNQAVIIKGEYENSDVPPHGSVSEKTVLEIGDHFTKLLSETKHRGAFEQAYLGFSRLCSRLWKCNSEILHNLPRIWLDDLITAIALGDTKNSKLCATRRSAGVPFMVQALVTTELQVSGSPRCFQKCMSTLLDLATFENAEDKNTVTVETRTHCLNILRALYRHTALGEYVNPYVADGLMTAITGFNGATWAERNSSTLLFSSLVTRIFGVQRSKDSDMLCIRNRMTGRIFFLRYPKLYDFILKELSDVDANIDTKDFLKPSLYPVLLLLARLYPSSLEGTDSNLQLVIYIPYLLTCSKSCVLKTRQLAAKAMVPLISQDRYFSHFVMLINLLCKKDIKTNHCHGILLQILRLLQSISKDVKLDQFKTDEIMDLLKGSRWILDNISTERCCFVTAEAYVQMITLLTNKLDSIVRSHREFFTELEASLQIPSEIKELHKIHFSKEGFYIHSFHLKINLLYLLNRKSYLTNIFSSALKSPVYEVVLTALNYLFCIFYSDNLKEIDERFELGENEKDLVKKLSSNDIKCLLNEIKSSDFTNLLYNILKTNVFMVCRQKALMILSFIPESLDTVLLLFTQNVEDSDVKFKTLIDLVDSENDTTNFIYLRYINNYIQSSNKSSIYEQFSDESIELFSNMLYECSCPDKLFQKRMECANILVKHWEFFNWENNTKGGGLILQWAATLQLLDDDEESIRYKIADLANTFTIKQNKENSKHGNFLHNENKAKEIILNTFSMWMCRLSADHAIISLITLALINESSYFISDDDNINQECRVFDKGEVNIFQEEIAVAKLCTDQIKSILLTLQGQKSIITTSKQKLTYFCNILKSQTMYNDNSDLNMLQNILEELSVDNNKNKLFSILDRSTALKKNALDYFKIKSIIIDLSLVD